MPHDRQKPGFVGIWVIPAVLLLGACAGSIPGPFTPPLAEAETPGGYPNINLVPAPPPPGVLTRREQADAASRLQQLRDDAERQAQAAQQAGQASQAAALRARAALLQRCSRIVDPAALPRECRNL